MAKIAVGSAVEAYFVILGAMLLRHSSENEITTSALFRRGRRGLTVAAEQTLHTSQPSLSRQIRDLEDEVGARLLTRRARGIELTPAGRAFPEHARVVLSQVEAATSLRSSSCRFRGWTSWSLVPRRRHIKAYVPSEDSSE